MTMHSQPAPRTSTPTAIEAARERWRHFSQSVLTHDAMPATPFYDSELRQLWVGKILVKRFTQASDAQEILLMVFQEENWCRSIDDPLPVKDDQVAKQRLRTAVTNLNRRQRVPLLHFQIIRQGTGVAWQMLEDSDARTRHERADND